jgi:hypothetical protein
MRHAICAVLVAAFMAPVTAAELTMLATAAAQGPIQALEKAYRDVRIEGARRRARRHPGHHDIRGAAGVYVGRLGILKGFTDDNAIVRRRGSSRRCRAARARTRTT